MECDDMNANFKLIIAVVYLIACGLLLPISWSAESELVLYFPLNEGKGNTVKGLSDHKHVGKFEGKPTWTDGKFGKAIEFGGTNHVQIPLTKALKSLTKDFTVEFWAKKSDQQVGSWNYMVAADRVRWAVIHSNDDQRVDVWASNPGWSRQAKTKEPLPKEWTHIAVTFDTEDAVKIRINGKVKAESDSKPNETIPIQQCYQIGAIATAEGCPAGEQKFNGRIDDLVIYKGILSEDEIKRDMEGSDVGGLAVGPKGKLTTLWSSMRKGY